MEASKSDRKNINMSEQTPSSPATPVAPQTPTTEAPKTETPASEPTIKTEGIPTNKTPATEIKADAAADKTGADKVTEDKYELKVDGETLTLNKAEMIKYAQLGKAGQKRMQEAIEFQKQTKTNWENLQKALKEDPGSVLEDENIGLNKIQLAKKWLAEKMEQDAKSPEQIELEQLRSEKIKFEKEKQDALSRAEEEAEQRETEVTMKAMENEMLGAFKKYQLPNSAAMVDRMVGILEVARNNNLNVSIDDVAKIVRDDIRKDIQELAGMLPDDQFEELLGEIGIKKIKESTLKKMKSAPKVETTEVGKTKAEDSKPKKKMSIEEFMKPSWAK